MQVKFNTLKIQNFYSYGAMQEINFRQFGSTVILIDGIDKDTEGSKIGSGKSSLLAAITYTLYGETVSNVKANEIVNYIKGKEALVELEFEIANNFYKIQRGRKPKVLNIFKKIKTDSMSLDTDLDEWDNISKADDRDNEMLIHSIIKMNFETFLQTTLFSVASEHNKPFLNMIPSNQKKVLENIFNFDIHNAMVSHIKDILRDKQVILANLESSAKEITYANEKINKQIERLTESSIAFENKRNNQIAELIKKISFYKKINIDEEKEKYDFLGELKEHRTQINESIADLKSSQKDIISTIEKDNREIEIIVEKYHKEEIKNVSLKGNICPTCQQPWEDNNAISMSDERLVKYTTQLESYTASIKKNNVIANKLKATLIEKKDLLIEVKEAMEIIACSVERRELDNIDIVVTNLKKELEQLQTQENHHISEIEANKELLREIDVSTIDEVNLFINDVKDFIKLSEDQKVRGKFLRKFIKQSNDILREFKKLIPDYNIHIQFNPDFTIRVMKLGKEVSSGSLSNGEKRIGNIMIMMALMKVFKLKNNVEFNAMFMDEVLDSGINGTLLESVYAFIKNIAKQEKMRIYLISHREEIKEKSKEIIMVTKSRGISTIEINPTNDSTVILKNIK